MATEVAQYPCLHGKQRTLIPCVPFRASGRTRGQVRSGLRSSSLVTSNLCDPKIGGVETRRGSRFPERSGHFRQKQPTDSGEEAYFPVWVEYETGLESTPILFRQPRHVRCHRATSAWLPARSCGSRGVGGIRKWCWLNNLLRLFPRFLKL